MRLEGHCHWVNSLAFSFDGLQLASGCHDRTVILWDALSGTHDATLEGHSKSVKSVTFSLDGLYSARCSEDREVHLWDTISRTIIAQLNRTNDTRFAEFSIGELLLLT
jgi:WD40 repeat protein